MEFFRVRAQVSRCLGAVGCLLLLASLASGCALYDAFQNSPEDGNNGDENTCDLTIEVSDGDPLCFAECRRSSDFEDALSPSCEDGGTCGVVYNEPDPSGGACLSTGADGQLTQCAIRKYTDYASSDVDEPFIPCDGSQAEYHVAAMPQGGVVAVGCRKIEQAAANGSVYGVRVLWLNNKGELDGTRSSARQLFTMDDLDLEAGNPATISATDPPRIRAVEATNQDAVLMVLEVQTDGGQTILAAGAVEKTHSGAVELHDLGQREVCDNPLYDHVSLDGFGEWWAVGSCAKDSFGEMFVRVAIVETTTNGTRIVDTGLNEVPFDKERFRFQGLERVGDTSGSTGDADYRYLLLDLVMKTLESVPLTRDPSMTNPYEVGPSNTSTTKQVSTNADLVPAKPTGFVPAPAASHEVEKSSQTPRIFAAAHQANRPGPLTYASAANQSLSLGQDFGDAEQVLDIDLVGKAASELNYSPSPQDGSSLVSFVVLTIVGTTGSQQHFGRLYGLDVELNVKWTREVGRGGEFIPQHMTVSPNGPIAVSGRTGAGEPRMIFMDHFGRAFCSGERLAEAAGSSGATQ